MNPDFKKCLENKRLYKSDDAKGLAEGVVAGLGFGMGKSKGILAKVPKPFEWPFTMCYIPVWTAPDS